MSVLLLLAALQAAPVEDEIVVLGRRLGAIQVMVGRDARGRFTCDLNQSSGNAKLDAALCKTAATCVRKGAADQPAVKACIDGRKPALLEDVRQTLRGKVAS